MDLVVVSRYLLLCMVCGFSLARGASNSLTMDFEKYVQLYKRSPKHSISFKIQFSVCVPDWS